MINISLLFLDQTLKNTYLKCLKIYSTNSQLTLPEFYAPETPINTHRKEYLVSEAMKRTCYNKRKVIVIGVNKQETEERDINCGRFKSLADFMPYPVNVPEVLSKLLNNNIQIELECGCTVFGIKGKQLFSGRLLDNICHDINNILPLAIEVSDIDKLINITNRLDILNKLFIPSQDKKRIDKFISELKDLQEIAIKSDLNLFKSEYEKFRNKKATLLKGFPHIGGTSK